MMLIDNQAQSLETIAQERDLKLGGYRSDPSATTMCQNATERGASLVEYALLVALIAVVAIAAVRTLGQTVSGQYSAINDNLLDPSQIP